MAPSTWPGKATSKHASDPYRKRTMQRVTSGLGTLFVSPQKSRPGKRKKPQNLFGYDITMQGLEMELEDLLARPPPSQVPDSLAEIDETRKESRQGAEDWEDVDPWGNLDELDASASPDPCTSGSTPLPPSAEDPMLGTSNPVPPRPKKHQTTPNQRTKQFYVRWLELLPSLVLPYLEYFERSYQQKGPPPLDSPSIIEIEVEWCPSSSLPVTLVKFGLFPTAPFQPRQAISIELLSFLKSLFERACNASYALANALSTHYLQRGFRLMNPQGKTVADPFRKGLTSAMQWFDCLVQDVETRTEAILQHAATLSSSKAVRFSEYARILKTRCPSCFGGKKFGGKHDIIVSVDGNFNHRHVRSKWDCPRFFKPNYFLSKETVDQVGEIIADARKQPAKSRRPKVPDAALDICQDSHEAGSGSNVKTSLEHFDDGGVMALVCRHDIPLFLTNIDTPGEQQKYPIALIKHLFSFIPEDATVMVQYDVGCIVDRSCEQFNILPETMSSRLSFSTSIMHSYAHEFTCQIVYNPRYCEGVGLSDGEGTERLWSRLTGLIRLTRMCGRKKRIYYLDRQVAAIGAEMRDELGSTLRHRAEKNVPMHEKTADKAIAKVLQTPAELMAMWEQQKQTQLSVGSHAPARVKKELEAILNLQTELESVEQSIQSTRNFVSLLRSASGITKTLLDTLEARQQDIGEKVEELYASLNVHKSFPELKGVDLELVRCLLLARDIKMNIRKRAIGSFNEYDKLNQAQGGGGPPVGTKAHQYYRQSIAKQMPVLHKLIRRFNDLCARAKSLYKPEWNIPVPEQLPEEISLLKKDPGLLEDVWISSAPSTTFQWLYDSDIREAMRAVHCRERCVEEKQRIGMEMDNLCRWFGTEIMAAKIALVLPENAAFHAILNHYRSRILGLKGQWSTRMTSALFEAHVTAATTEARQQYARLVG
ncbi:hypothetical protein H1R20_g13589, partial [Candolleomyces eurysporus]